MEIEIIQACGIHGEMVEVGDVVEVDEPTAVRLIGIGRAKPAILTQDPAITHRDPETL